MNDEGPMRQLLQCLGPVAGLGNGSYLERCSGGVEAAIVSSSCGIASEVLVEQRTADDAAQFDISFASGRTLAWRHAEQRS